MSKQPGTARPKKQKKKQNALKHGAYSRELMLPGEKMSDYKQLRADLYEEHMPDGRTEHLVVDELVDLYWRKQRIDRYVRLVLKQRVDGVHQKSEGARHRKNLKNLASEFSCAETFEAVEQILSMLSPYYVSIIKYWVPLEKCEDPARWGAAIGEHLSNLKPGDQWDDSDKFMAVVDLYMIEIELDRSDRLGDKIDRTIKRLVQIKLAKQISRSMRKNPEQEPNLINPPERAGAKHVVEGGKVLIQPDISVSPAKAVNELDCPQEWPMDYETERREEIAPAESGKEHLDAEHVKVEVFTKPTLFSIAEMERFFATWDASRGNEGRLEGGGFKLWI
jgi:hypothetical protein